MNSARKKVRFSNREPPTCQAPELSIIDRKWGKLFDEGEPTERLRGFLRGLANHLVSDDTYIYIYGRLRVD